MKIPFDINYRPQVDSGEYKVETRDGRPARIICWDAKADDGACIIALIPGYGGEEAYQHFPNGKAFSSKSSDEDCADLFIITPEPEPTEFEEKVKELIGYYPIATNENKGSLIYEVQKSAAVLLELAKKKICKGCPANLEGYIKGRQDTLEKMIDYMQDKFTMDNPNIQKLDPNVVINTTTTGTNKAE